MDKQEVYEFLTGQGIWHEITEHEAVFTMEEASHLTLPYPQAEAKNLFLTDDKKRSWYLLTVHGSTRIDLKAFRKVHGTRPLSFANDTDLHDILGLTPGSVTPLGILNDEQRQVQFYLDSSFLEGDGIIGVHPNDNTAAVWLHAQDLLAIIRAHGNTVTLFDPTTCTKTVIQ